jgi:hypothetical protein
MSTTHPVIIQFNSRKLRLTIELSPFRMHPNITDCQRSKPSSALRDDKNL